MEKECKAYFHPSPGVSHEIANALSSPVTFLTSHAHSLLPSEEWRYVSSFLVITGHHFYTHASLFLSPAQFAFRWREWIIFSNKCFCVTWWGLSKSLKLCEWPLTNTPWGEKKTSACTQYCLLVEHLSLTFTLFLTNDHNCSCWLPCRLCRFFLFLFTRLIFIRVSFFFFFLFPFLCLTMRTQFFVNLRVMMKRCDACTWCAWRRRKENEKAHTREREREEKKKTETTRITEETCCIREKIEKYIATSDVVKFTSFRFLCFFFSILFFSVWW